MTFGGGRLFIYLYSHPSNKDYRSLHPVTPSYPIDGTMIRKATFSIPILLRLFLVFSKLEVKAGISQLGDL